MLVRFPCSATATSPRPPPQSSATRRRTWRSCARRSARTRCPSPSSPETLSAHIILRGAFGQTNDRGDNFDKTEFVDLENDVLEDVGAVHLVFDVIGGDIGKRSARLIRAGGTLVTIAGPTEARPAGGLAIDFVLVSDRAQLSLIV